MYNEYTKFNQSCVKMRCVRSDYSFQMFTFTEILRKQRQEHSPSRILIRLFTLRYKRQSRAGHWVSEVQLILCEDAECFKSVIIVVLRSPLQKDLSNNCLVIVIVYAKGISRETMNSNCCCLHQVVNSGTQNCVRAIKNFN